MATLDDTPEQGDADLHGEGLHGEGVDDHAPDAARRGRPAGAVIAMIVAGILLLFGTTALAKILNPDLAAMPPIMRKPASAVPPPDDPVQPVVASARPSPGASRSRRPAPPPTRSATATSAATPPVLVSIEAESAERSSRPRVRAVSGASGGMVLWRIGVYDEFVRFTPVTVPEAGRYTVTVHYISTEPRETRLRVNGGGSSRITFPPTGSSTAVGTRELSVTLVAGGNTLQFDNIDGSYAPDLDRITISR